MVTRTKERTGFLADIVVTAVEGGIGYWAKMREYHWRQDAAHNIVDASVEIVTDAQDGPEDPGPTVWKKVGPEEIALGIDRIKAPGFQINRANLSSILVGEHESDAGEIDSEAADCIVQAALFGELVYG